MIEGFCGLYILFEVLSVIDNDVAVLCCGSFVMLPQLGIAGKKAARGVEATSHSI
jgi:hypothetical protein